MDILLYAKERDLRLEQINIRNFVEEIVKEIEPGFKSQKIKLEDDFSADLGEFEVDVTYVHSALLNIFENAADACLRDKTKNLTKLFSGPGNMKKKLLLK